MKRSRHPIARRVMAAAALFVGPVLSSCGDAGDGSLAERLNGRTFVSQSVDGRTLVDGTGIRLTFDGGEIGADAGCNSMSAPVEATDSVLVIPAGSMSTTEIGCDPERHAQDDWLAGFLLDRPHMGLEGDELTLSADGVTIALVDRVVADPDRPLIGSRWRVDTVLFDGAASSVSDDEAVTIDFQDDVTLAIASAGCTQAKVPVKIDEGSRTLQFGDAAIDTIGCPEPWPALVEVIRGGEAQYSIVASRLEITAGGLGIGAVTD